MEASMRVVSLVVLLDFVHMLQSAADAECAGLVRRIGMQLRLMLAEHGSFVWQTREYTDVRGNHFAANIVALLLAGLSLGDEWRPGRRWVRYANRFLEGEVSRQFLPDGVNFEKSCGYHKLVLELFALAALARQRCGNPVSRDCAARLIAAARFSDALCRPDGIAPCFGDTDDAVALPLVIGSPRSHGPVVELIRALFAANVGTVTYAEPESLAALFLVGRAGAAPTKPASSETLVFESGGYVIVRAQSTGFFLMMDVGEVGLLGRGGHGHNDLLSFELFLHAQPVVIDPGCPCYTADLAKRDDYRRTARHSTIQLFDEEMARFSGHWRIENEAHPLGVEVSEAQGAVTIVAGHDGYERLSPGARVQRRITVIADEQRVVIEDRIDTSAPQTPVRWIFPLASGAVSLNEAGATLSGDTVSTAIRSEISLRSVAASMSPGYGREVAGCALVGEGLVGPGSHQRRFEITRAAVQKPESRAGARADSLRLAPSAASHR
jgi:hypothetical protein